MSTATDTRTVTELDASVARGQLRLTRLEAIIDAGLTDAEGWMRRVRGDVEAVEAYLNAKRHGPDMTVAF